MAILLLVIVFFAGVPPASQLARGMEFPRAKAEISGWTASAVLGNCKEPRDAGSFLKIAVSSLHHYPFLANEAGRAVAWWPVTAAPAGVHLSVLDRSPPFQFLPATLLQG